MTCAKDVQFLQVANSLIAKGEMTASDAVLKRDKAQSLQQGGFNEWLIPSLAALSPGAAKKADYSGSGTWLYLAKSGTTAGAEFTIEFGGKSLTRVVPGTKMVGNFDGFTLTNTGTTAGNARFIVGTREDINYEEWDIADGAGQTAFMPSPAGIAGASVTNAAVAFGANAPSGVMSYAPNIRGARAVRCYIYTNNGPITAGFIRWWLKPTNNPNQNGIGVDQWWPSPAVEPIVTGSNRAVSSDFEVGLRDGTAYAELYGNAAGGGAGWIIQFEVL